MNDLAANSLAEYRKVNVENTLKLANQAVAVGVRRFIFISSVKVNGEQTALGSPFREEDSPAPCDPYGISKMEAEQGLRSIAQTTGMEVVIVRPPLVYGPDVKANFATLMRAVKKGLPLPLGAVKNHRSLIAVDNLVDFLITCIDHPKAVNETFLVSDGHDLSVPDLIRRCNGCKGTFVTYSHFYFAIWRSFTWQT
jgi:nucleoside-diphosphate-sugar epimerase